MKNTTKTYTITENEISAHASKEAARRAMESETGAQYFTSERELARLAEKWPMARLVDVRNSIPGLERVNPKTYKSKSVAVSAIWKAAQALVVPELVYDLDAGALPGWRTRVTQMGDVDVAAAKPAAETANTDQAAHELKRYHLRGANPYRPESKSAAAFAAMARDEGATWEDLHRITGWQRHVLRKFVTLARRKSGGAMTEAA